MPAPSDRATWEVIWPHNGELKRRESDLRGACTAYAKLRRAGYAPVLRVHNADGTYFEHDHSAAVRLIKAVLNRTRKK